ncbi:EipA family protein [Desulforhabdus amnigena]|uniref:DUF1134 domain-containing protein n=1 Tax=Desulforhabdus amnigena TaxID=40218 RepID=A0A9W6D376_9BACT|nr:EipA family protein [Desulforhabdus amnigena]NLJ27958.1 DUF1134 domain-containing protein [Deltaproteobacteria bacterium]GLI33758.1 hypothetical protein DAMNIGENAA_11910 [Desulforhabdus amnigena]
MQRVSLRCSIVFVVVAAFLAFVPVPGFTAEEQTPDAIINFETGSVAAGIGFSWGGGTLSYKGKSYPLKVDGMSVGKVGITKATATGTVYNLKKLEDINGNYVGVGAGASLGGGAGAVTMKNQNGVVIEVVATTKGLGITLGSGGVNINLK